MGTGTGTAAPALAPATAGVRLRLLGEPTLTAGDAASQALTPGDAALLARLVLTGPQSRAALASLLWPDNDAASAATNLRQRIYRLKRMAGLPVVLGARTLSLAADISHDVWPADAAHAAGWLAAEANLLGACEFTAHDELAAWLNAQRLQRAQHRLRHLHEGARSLAARGDGPLALRVAQRAVHEAPLDEVSHRLLIELLHQSGNSAGAMTAYQVCMDALSSELGVEPSPATRRLWAQLQAVEPPSPPDPLVLPLALLRPPRLVAREGTWRQMAAAAAGAQALVLQGEAGMGKSRLLGDFVASQSGWMLVAASPGDHSLPFALLARLLSQCTAERGCPEEGWVGAELARLAPAAGAPASDMFTLLRLQQAVRAALLQWRQRGLAGLALDDLHHADDSSVDLLLPLVTGTGAAGLAWLLATRPGPSAARLDGLAPLPVTPLAQAQVLEFVQSLGLAHLRADEWAPALLERTGGNPLFMLQTLAAGFQAQILGSAPPFAVLPVPASLQALLAARLEKLSAVARSIARLASVAGPDFSLQLACQLLQATPAALADPWLELESAHVLHEGRFAHDLIREASAAITPAAVAELLHAQVAAALQTRDAPAGRVAEHWDAAGRWPQAAAAYERAAAHAHTRSAWQDELFKLRAAVRCHHATATVAATRAAFESELRAFELRVTNSDLADDTRLEGEALLGRATGPEQQAAVLVVLAYYFGERYEPALALPLAQRAMGLAQQRNNPRLHRLAAQRLGAALSRLGRHDEAVQTFRDVLADLSSLSPIERLNWLAEFGAVLSSAGRRTEALPVLESVVNNASAVGQWAVAAAALSSKALVLLYLGRTSQGMQAHEQTLALYRRAGVDGDALLIDEMNCAGNLRDLGHFAAYLNRAERLPQALRAAGSPFWAANSEHDLATAWAWLGRADLALRLLAGDVCALPPMMQAARLATRARLARDFGVGGHSAHPGNLLQQAAALLQHSQPSGPSNLALAIELQSTLDGDPALGLVTAARLEADGLQQQNMMLACNAGLVRLRLLLATGDAGTSAAAAGVLLERIEAFGPPAGIYPPELWWHAHLALKRPHAALAANALAQAAQWLRDTAANHLPALHRESFLARNPINRAVLAAAQALGV